MAVLGAGSWGSTLAALLSQAGGHDVALWEVDERVAERYARLRDNPYLGIQVPEAVDITADLGRAVAGRSFVVLATPSEHLRSSLRALGPVLEPGATLICAAKGLEARTGLTLDRVIAEIFPDHPMALLSGPTFAKEIANGLPAAVVAA